MLKQSKKILSLLALSAALMPAQGTASIVQKAIDGESKFILATLSSAATTDTPSAPAATAGPTLPPTDTAAPFSYKIVLPSKIDTHVSKFAGDIDLEDGKRGELSLFGLAAPECAKYLRFNVKDYRESMSLHPIALEIATDPAAEKACTKEALQAAIDAQTAVDLSNYDKKLYPNLIVGKTKLENSGRVLLIGPSKCSANAKVEDASCFEAKSIDGIDGFYRTLKDEEEQDRKETVEKQQKEISGLCLEAMNGSRPALKSLEKLLGSKFKDKLAKIEQENIIPKELEAFETRVADNLSASAYKSLINDILKYFKDNKKSEAAVKEKLMALLAKIEARARGVLSLGEKDLLAKDPRRKEIRKAALEAILEIDPYNKEIDEALASIPLEDAVEACGAYSQKISQYQTVIKSQNMKLQLAAQRQLAASEKQCNQAYMAAENKYQYLALKSWETGDEEMSNKMAAYQQMFQPAQGSMPWYNPMTGQTENRNVTYTNQFTKMIGSAQQTLANNVAANPTDIYRWYRNDSGQPLPQAVPQTQQQIPQVGQTGIPAVPR